MLNAETKHRLDACRDILVGKLPLPTDQIELITLALIYKFMDDLDEESVKLGGKRSFFIGTLEKYRWRALLPQTLSADERMNLFAEGIEAIGKAEHLPALFRDIFRNSFLKFRDGRILTLFLNEVNAFEYSHSEELGNAFEYLLKTMGIQAENGQFRTPRHIINFMVECLDPQPNDRILDPACGTGGFLVSAYKHILARYTSSGSKIPGDKLTHDQRQKVYSNLTGYDVTDLMVKLSKVNLFLHGFPDPAIHIYDTLTNEARWNEKADLILANPPFMTPKGGVSPHTKFRVSARKSEVLFTDYIAEHLTPDGRGAVIVPNGIVATTQNAYVKLRKFLVEDSLVAVVSLPAGVFNPYSGVKTSILFLDKRLARTIDSILFLKIAADGFDLGAQRRPIAENDLPEAERIVKAWLKESLNQSTSTAWKVVDKQELLAERHVVLATERFLGEAGAVSECHPTTRLGEVADYVRGLTYGKEDESDSPTPIIVLRAQNVSLEEGRIVLDDLRYLRSDFEGSSEKRLRTDDILVCSSSGSKAHLGKVAFVESDLPHFFGGFMGVLRSRRSIIEPRFLFRLLTSKHHKAFLAGLTEGANINNLKLTEYLQYEIPLPPLEEQRRIVSEIENYQKVIDGARQIVDSYQISLNPEPDWRSMSLGQVCEFIDYRGKTPEKSKDGIPLITAKNVRWGFITKEPAEFVTEETYKKWMTRGFPKRGDVLFTTEAPLAMAALVDNGERFALAQRIICLSPNPELAVGGYVFRVLLSAPVQEAIQIAATGTTVLGIKASSLKEIEIPVPPLSEQREIVAELDTEAAQIEAARALIPRFEAKIQRVLDRVWGNSVTSAHGCLD
jgi:type I restriction enzyme M protein